MRKTDSLPDCPVAACVQCVGSKWKLLILRNLLARPWRFNELCRSLDGVSRKVLTQCLRDMEEDGLILRKDYGQKPPKVEYSLTETGESLRPVIDAMARWGEEYRRKHGGQP